jgi:hypothetical protein
MQVLAQESTQIHFVSGVLLLRLSKLIDIPVRRIPIRYIKPTEPKSPISSFPLSVQESKYVPRIIPFPNLTYFLIILLLQLNLLEVAYDALFVDRFCKDRIASVSSPRDEDLGFGGSYGGRDGLDGRVLGEFGFTDCWRVLIPGLYRQCLWRVTYNCSRAGCTP